jgi:hypothetical protein
LAHRPGPWDPEISQSNLGIFVLPWYILVRVAIGLQILCSPERQILQAFTLNTLSAMHGVHFKWPLSLGNYSSTSPALTSTKRRFQLKDPHFGRYLLPLSGHAPYQARLIVIAQLLRSASAGVRSACELVNSIPPTPNIPRSI